MFRVLENGELLGILADLNVQEKEGVFVDFFGVPASTTTSIAKFALKTGAVVLPAFAVWEEAKKNTSFISNRRSNIKKAMPNSPMKKCALTQKITKSSKNTSKIPEQWLWIHKRWNTRPKGEKGLY
jgi:KDO2-lipid IV(A) lauroyltransferase